MKKSILIAPFALLAGIAWGQQSVALKSDILFEPHRDLKWKTEIYDKIMGDTYEEKVHNARTTWEMKAVSEIELWQMEDRFYVLSQKLYQSLEPSERELFLKTHSAWKEYVVLQARFLARDEGSVATLYAREVMKTEIRRRTQLYEELLKGGNLYTTGLSMYK